MRDTGSPAPAGTPLNADDVAAFLQAHPDFLIQHPDLVQHLAPPIADYGDGVKDLQFFMLQRLRADLAASKEQQRALIAATRANIHNQNRVHAAVLCLLDARSFEQLIQSITNDLAMLLHLDVVSLLMETNESEQPQLRSGIRLVPPGTVDHWLGRRDIILHGAIEGEAELHGSSASLVRSELLLRLRISPDAPPGLLCLGSRDPDMFHPGQATEIALFLTRVVERCIRGWLELST